MGYGFAFLFVILCRFAIFTDNGYIASVRKYNRVGVGFNAP